ncbi:MAG TPA: DMT family transporter [Anaerolineae bacterium]|nr:DMT family transporter [Anaerolineae bacterium]HQK12759.1 DMT family transporter [Anaerolineae bacterium]
MMAHSPSNPETRARLTRGYGIALISAAFLSTTAIFIRYLTLTYALPPLILAFWRDVFVMVTLLPVLARVRSALLRVARRHIPYLAAYGLVLSLFNVLWTFSVTLNGAAVATVLCYCSAAFTALLGRWLLKEPLNGVKWLAIVLSLTGCALVAGMVGQAAWQISVSGLLVGMLTGLSYAGYSLMGRSAAQRGLNPWTTLAYTFGFATLYLFIFNLLPETWLPGGAASLRDFFWLGKAWTGWGMLFLLSAGPTIAGFGLYNVSLSYLPSSVANLIATSEPVFTAISAYLLLGERLNGIQILGSLMILGGVVALRLYDGWLETRTRLALVQK